MQNRRSARGQELCYGAASLAMDAKCWFLKSGAELQPIEIAINSAAAGDDVTRRARRRPALRLLPYLFFLYIVAFLDRTNVGLAALQMPADLGFSDKVMGLGAGIFFIGYFLLEIPGALIVERWSARRWIARIMISWGILTVLMAFIHTERAFYVVRFLVGAAEAGFFPGVIVYLTHWFRYEDRAKALGVFYAAMPLSYVIGSPLGGWLLGVSWFGLRGWRWLFIVEGIPAIVFGVITIFYLTDWPSEAKWLRADERDWITEQLKAEKRAKEQRGTYSVWEALRNRDVILLTLSYFFSTTGGYGINFWLPTMLKRLSGQNDLRVTVLAALPYAVAFIVQQMNGWHSDRTGERRWHAAVPTFLCGVTVCVVAVSRPGVGFFMVLFTIAIAGYFAYHPCFWPVPTIFLSESPAAASIGLINAVGNLGGFLGPFIMGNLVARTRHFSAGLLYLVGNFALSAAFMLLVRANRHSAPGEAS